MADNNAIITNSLFESSIILAGKRGAVQLSFKPKYEHGNAANVMKYSVALEYMVATNWQVEVEWDSYVSRMPHQGDRASGSSNWSIGTQYNFINMANSTWSSALGFKVVFPLGDVNKGITD